MTHSLASFTDVLFEDKNSQPLSLSPSVDSAETLNVEVTKRPPKGAGQQGEFRSVDEVDPKYRDVFSYTFFNLVQSRVIEDALYSDKSMVVCAPTGSGKTVVFEMAIVQLLMELEAKNCDEDFKIIYMAPVKALCTEKLTEWYPKFTKLGLLCIEVTGDTDVDFSQLKPYKLIITTPEKWDMLTRRWRDHKGLVEIIKLFLIDEVHILNDAIRGPVLEAVVSRMKTIESSAQSEYRIEQLQKEIQGGIGSKKPSAPSIRFVAVSATVSNPEDVAAWLGTERKPAVFYKFGDECRPVKLKRVVEGYPCTESTSIFKFDIILNYKLWPIIQKYHAGKPTLIFCNTRKSVIFTAETLSRELTVSFNLEQKAKLAAVAATIKNKKLQTLVMSGVGCHHAGLLFEERMNIERAFRNRDLPILITTTTLAMGVNLPAHLVIIKNTQQYVNGAYQEYSISTVLQMVGRAGRPQFDTEATAVIMTRSVDKPRYQALVGGSEPLQSYLHKRLAENLNSEAALRTVGDVAQCVQWLRSTFLFVRAAKDPKRYLGLPQNSPQHLISKKIEELCVKAMNGLASSGLITMDDACCIESTEAGRLMSIFYLDLETMKLIMKIQGTENLERLLWLICESHELADMHLRVDERRCLNALNRNNTAATIRFPMKGKISSRQMKLNCVIQAILGCLPIPDPSLGQEAMKIMRIADRVCRCLVSYVVRPDLITRQPEFYSAVVNTIILAKCIAAHLWENSHFLSKQLKGIGPTFSTLLATAGKINFMLLEESHPRDLERIMNKGPPAGNVLRKQINLLPKYQLTITPVDERTVTLQLSLLNQAYLADNIDQLTAGESHKSYIVVGDCHNHLLLLTSFKDRDLISVYDGNITYEIKRKHNFEHKIFAHCISSTFVGVDVQSEYLFKDLEHLYTTTGNEDMPKRKPLKQTCITETFKERKRRNANDVDITQSKEKKKRDNDIIEKLKSLKESFRYLPNQPKSYQFNQNKIENKGTACNINKNVDEREKSSTILNLTDQNTKQAIIPTSILVEDNMDCDDIIDDEKIDSILNEIENEISKAKPKSQNAIEKSKTLIAKEKTNIDRLNSCQTNFARPENVSVRRNFKPAPKSNYNFIEMLEKNIGSPDDDEKRTNSCVSNGFSDTIKDHINKYLQNTDIKSKSIDKNVEMLLEYPENVNIDGSLIGTNDVELLNTDVEDPSIVFHEPPVKYTIYEILTPRITKDSNKTMVEHNVFEGTNIGTIVNERPESANVLLPYSQTNAYNSSETCSTIDEKQSKQVGVTCPKNNTKNPDISYFADNSLGNFDSQEFLKDGHQIRTNSAVRYYTSDEATENFNTSRNKAVAKNAFPHVDPLGQTDCALRNNDCAETISPNLTENKQKDCNNSYSDTVTEPNNTRHNLIDDQLISSKNFEVDDTNNEDRNEKIKLNASISENEKDGVCIDVTNFNQNTLIQRTTTNEYTMNEDRDHNDENASLGANELTRNICQELVSRDNIGLKNRNDQLSAREINMHSKLNALMPCHEKYCANTDTVKLNHNHFTGHNTTNEYATTLYRVHENANPYFTEPVKNFGQEPVSKESIDFNMHNKIACGQVLSSNENNSRTHSSILLPEVVGMNQTHNYLNNISSTSTNQQHKGQYFKNYSYSGTKIDVYTKRYPEHSIKVVREVKMDLNIKEIISREKIDAKSNFHEQEHDNTGEKVRLDLKPPCNIQNYSNDNTPKSYAMVRRHTFEKREQHITSITAVDKTENQCHEKPTNQSFAVAMEGLADLNKEFNEIEITTSQKDFNEVRETENKDDNVSLAAVEKSPQSNIEDCVPQAQNRIENILQKYSRILGKEASKKEFTKNTTATHTLTRETNLHKSLKNKPNRPFKISDIHKLDVPIPSTIIQDGASSEFHTPIEIEHEPETQKPNIVNLRHEDNFNDDNDIIDTYIELEPIEPITEIDLEPCMDFKLDQSMLDPKAVLQSANDEIIIPPPAQFCDGDYSPVYDLPYEDSQCDEEYLANNETHNESIFEDYAATELTPSKEIETWTLSREDSWVNPQSIATPAKSFTVMRKNTVGDASPTYDTPSTSRRDKLGQFKFHHKSKLILRR